MTGITPRARPERSAPTEWIFLNQDHIVVTTSNHFLSYTLWKFNIAMENGTWPFIYLLSMLYPYFPSKNVKNC